MSPAELSFRPGTLRQTLRRGFGTVMVLVAGVGLAGIFGVGIATQRVEHLSRVLTPAVEANAEALQLMLDAETAVRGYQLTGDAAFLVPYEAAQDDVLGAVTSTQSLGELAGVEAPYERELAAARAWLEEYAADVVDGAGPPDEATSDAGKELFDEFRAEQRAVAQALSVRREEVRTDARQYRAAVVPGLGALTALGVVFATLVTRGTVRAVAGPLDRVRDVLERQRLGDHAARAPVAGPSEVRDVAEAVNALADESDRLREQQAEQAALRRRTRDAVRLVRDELGRVAVLEVAAGAVAELVGADAVVLRYLGRGGRRHDDVEVPDGVWPARGSRRPAPVPHGPDDVALARALAGATEVVVLEHVPGPTPADGGTEGAAARLVRAVAPGAMSAVVAPVAVGGEVLGLAVVAFHATHRLTEDEEQALGRLCDDLGQALEQSDLFERQLRLVDQLQELDRQKSVFLSNVSHELRTPLTSITGYAEMLLDGDGGALGPSAAEMVTVVERNAQRLRELIEDLLTLSQMESGAHRGRREAVDLAEVTAAAVATLEPQARAGGVRLATHLGPDVPTIMGDVGQLERVVLNLAGNAVKFTPDGGSVDVRLDRHDGGVRLVVRDTGIGIPVEEQEDLFQRFFRASNAVEGAVPGTGLGLSIVRGVVEAHGGTLALRSAPGEGTEVEVTLGIRAPR
ncbi:ATP-binding protein [Actinotalea solisilvae]|uniref:ATP-binding protein n=1 Tax=Actinotalea solisilvae TaxID=2072922 RepID=UPI0018F2084D|nr:ATP-binding protein [Actinotalea solisilvae]